MVWLDRLVLVCSKKISMRLARMMNRGGPRMSL